MKAVNFARRLLRRAYRWREWIALSTEVAQVEIAVAVAPDDLSPEARFTPCSHLIDLKTRLIRHDLETRRLRKEGYC